jgi:HD-like signal output (HDOD) protein
MAKTAEEIRAYITDHSEFEEIGNRILHEWDLGAEFSLKAA